MAVEYTTNFRLPIPPAGKTPWQQYYAELANVLDAILGRFIAIGGFLGAWQNSTIYSAGQKLVDVDTGAVYEAVSDHTSAASPTTFAEDRENRSSLWTPWSSTATSSGVWESGRTYAVNEFVAEGARWAVCISAHTSTNDFDTDVASGYWSVLVDLTDYTSVTFPITVAQGGTNATSATNARTNLGLVIGTNVQAYSANLATVAGYPDVTNLTTVQGFSAGQMASFATLLSATITSAGYALLDDADASTQRTTLGLGTTATLNVGTSANNVVQLDSNAKLPAVDGSALTNLPSAPVEVPPGCMLPYCGSSAPSGWLLCDGSAVSRSTYSALFAVIGGQYGSGDGSTTFNVPQMTGRLPVGLDAAQSVVAGATSLGAQGGSNVLSTHAHSGASFSGTTSANNGTPDGTTVGSGNQNAPNNHTHTFSGTTGNTGNNTSAPQQMPPFNTFNYIIKT